MTFISRSKTASSYLLSNRTLVRCIIWLKALNQKLYVDNLAYLLWDIYGIENKIVQHRVTNVFIHVSGNFFT
jgi:hypothetical protein